MQASRSAISRLARALALALPLTLTMPAIPAGAANHFYIQILNSVPGVSLELEVKDALTGQVALREPTDQAGQFYTPNGPRPGLYRLSVKDRNNPAAAYPTSDLAVDYTLHQLAFIQRVALPGPPSVTDSKGGGRAGFSMSKLSTEMMILFGLMLVCLVLLAVAVKRRRGRGGAGRVVQPPEVGGAGKPGEEPSQTAKTKSKTVQLGAASLSLAQYQEFEAAMQGGQASVAYMLGAYRLDGLLGEGGVARVYQATQLDPQGRTGLVRAVKIPHSAVLTKAAVNRNNDLQSIRDEHHLRRALGYHRGFLEYYEPGQLVVTVGKESLQVPYLVMEKLSGQPLGRVAPGLDQHSKLRVMGQVMEALKKLHELSPPVVHRDLKPDNIIVTVHDQATGSVDVKVIDLGAHKQSGKLTQAYASPEHFDQANNVSPLSDLFSAGLVFFELMEGRLPYAPRQERESYADIIGAKSGDFSLVFSAVDDPRLKSIIARLLKKNTRERFHSAQDVITALLELRL